MPYEALIAIYYILSSIKKSSTGISHYIYYAPRKVTFKISSICLYPYLRECVKGYLYFRRGV